MKKLISMLLVLCMVLGMSVSAFAEGEAITWSGEVTLTEDVVLDSAVEVSSTLVVNLNGHSISMSEKDIAGDGVFHVVANGDLTIKGTGTIDGHSDGNKWDIAIFADGGKVTIEGGNYTNKGACSDSAADKADTDSHHHDLIYAKNGGSVVIKGGTFTCENPNWVLNCNDESYKAGDTTITVYGGTFNGFNPADNAAEGEGTNFVADGYESIETNGVWTVKEKQWVLSEDTSIDAILRSPYGNTVGYIQKGELIDGKGFTLTVKGDSETYDILTYGGTIQNLTIVGGRRGIVLYSPTEDVIIDNVTIDSPGYAINTAEHPTVEGMDLIVSNSTINGWTSFDGIASASFTKCSFSENSAKYWQNRDYDQDYDRLLKPYVDVTFTNCEFEKDFYIDLSTLEANKTVTLNDSTVDGTIITKDNYENLITIELPSGRTLEDCVVFEHKHSWSEQPNGYDGNFHWFECTTEGCDATQEKAAHIYTDGECVCGAVEPHEHSWSELPNGKDETHHWFECTAEDCDEIKDEAEHTKETEGQWTVDGEPTCTEDGFMTWCCTGCGLIMDAKTVEGSALGHTYVDGVCKTCGEADSSAEGPAGDGATGEVPTVKHEHAWSTEWTKNETHHWNVCTAEGCDVTNNTLMNGYAAHTYTNGVCVCGAVEPVVEPDDSDDDWYYEEDEEEEDNHTSSSDMDEIIEDAGKNDTSVTIEDVNKNTTISEKAMEKAIEEGLDVEFKGSGYTLTLKNENADFSNFKGNFNPHIDTDASCNAAMKNELKENGIDSSDVQVIKTEFSGELPGEMELEFNLGKELRGKKVYFYYWNPELGQYELIPHTVNGNKLKVNLSHFSTYIVTDEPIAGAVVHKGATVVGNVSGDKVNPSTGANDFVGAAVAMAVVSSMGVVVLNKRR